eukprot:CAMPEP_0184305258 /NCGR_PEP_ID=MMETSP1049-20130417/14576_1 /TAXON_ID=77928 /ORGANISM="Proteomonas sulcata, Strain CCMP704" /LENGTH=207 /DNA_ID=CAMNT_0026617275 /DNA_START=192 /DNA_END=815 /DNA_ORIENTATION=+
MAQILKRQALICVPFKETRDDDGMGDLSSDDDLGGDEEMHEDEAVSGEEYEDSASDGEREYGRARGSRQRATMGASATLRKRKSSKRLESRGPRVTATDKDQRQWRMELQREEDGRRMASLSFLAEESKQGSVASGSSQSPSLSAASIAGGKGQTPVSPPVRTRPVTSGGPGARQPRPIPSRPQTATTASKRLANKQALAAKAYGLP